MHPMTCFLQCLFLLHLYPFGTSEGEHRTLRNSLLNVPIGLAIVLALHIDTYCYLQ